MSEIIQFLRVSKEYPPGVVALDRVSLRVTEASIVYLAGPSGAGKSTLLRLLRGDESPSEGQILVDGRSLARFSARDRAHLRRRVGLVPQDLRLLPELSAIENVAMALEVQGESSREARATAEAALDVARLTASTTLPVRCLSGGEQRRVAIARAMVGDPAVLLCDEPTVGLDPELADEMLALLDRIRSRGTTVLVAAHVPPAPLSNRAAVYLRGGRVEWVEGNVDAEIAPMRGAA